MLPLALIAQSRGYKVSGSDRSYDQGRTLEKFDWLHSKDITIFPQDGSGVNDSIDEVITSTAVETTIPDIKSALDQNIAITHRAAFLARLFNDATTRVAAAGTSGKSTVTAMIAFILHQLGADPTVMNGAVMTNFMSDEYPYASALTGQGDIFVTEADESDGSFLNFKPSIAVITNIALDHKSVDDLHDLFDEFAMRCDCLILNADNVETKKLAERHPQKSILYALKDHLDLELSVIGEHNKSNACAALAVIEKLGLDVQKAKEILKDFTGTKRRLETVGTKNNITVIDDFAHNPDKVVGSMSALKEKNGRLIVLYQPHGFGMLKLTGAAMGQNFAKFMDENDRLIVTNPLYLGGTTDQSIGSDVIATEVPNASVVENKEAAFDHIIKMAQPNDRIVIMGARDDTLSEYANKILAAL